MTKLCILTNTIVSDSESFTGASHTFSKQTKVEFDKYTRVVIPATSQLLV